MSLRQQPSLGVLALLILSALSAVHAWTFRGCGQAQLASRGDSNTVLVSGVYCQLAALDAASGQVLWNRSDVFVSTQAGWEPAVLTHHHAFVVSTPTLTDTSVASLVALRLEDGGTAYNWTLPVVPENVVLIGSNGTVLLAAQRVLSSQAEGYLVAVFAIEESTGSILWNKTLPLSSSLTSVFTMTSAFFRFPAAVGKLTTSLAFQSGGFEPNGPVTGPSALSLETGEPLWDLSGNFSFYVKGHLLDDSTTFVARVWDQVTVQEVICGFSTMTGHIAWKQHLKVSNAFEDGGIFTVGNVVVPTYTHFATNTGRVFTYTYFFSGLEGTVIGKFTWPSTAQFGDTIIPVAKLGGSSSSSAPLVVFLMRDLSNLVALTVPSIVASGRVPSHIKWNTSVPALAVLPGSQLQVTAASEFNDVAYIAFQKVYPYITGVLLVTLNATSGVVLSSETYPTGQSCDFHKTRLTLVFHCHDWSRVIGFTS